MADGEVMVPNGGWGCDSRTYGSRVITKNQNGGWGHHGTQPRTVSQVAYTSMVSVSASGNMPAGLVLRGDFSHTGMAAVVGVIPLGADSSDKELIGDDVMCAGSAPDHHHPDALAKFDVQKLRVQVHPNTQLGLRVQVHLNSPLGRVLSLR